MKRILSALLSLLLMAMFYVYAVLQKDSEPQANMRWLVQEEERFIEPIGEIKSADAQTLANAFGVSMPAPSNILSGLCFDAKYKGQKAHMLEIIGEKITIQGVTPNFAAPLIRSDSIKFSESKSALLGYPLFKADGTEYNEYYVITQDAAFHFKLEDEDISPLQNLRLVHPEN
jgi:hypothetical protein